ncbi:MAG: Gfo/Idh/MocA family protein [Phycisphaeraceae bacterium]
MAKELHIGLIGSKFMGRTHSNAYLNVAKFFNTPLLPVMNTIAARDEKELKKFASRWGWRHYVTDWKQLCHDEQIDLVDIGTPNHVHKEQAIEALEAGKHVSCEKPLAGTLDDARAMVEAARKARNQHTFVWYNYRRCPAVALAHQLVKQGKLGRIYHIRGNYLQDWAGPDAPLMWRFQGDIAGSGALGDLLAHTIDMVRFITGDEVKTITGAMLETVIKERAVLDAGGGEISGRGAKTGRKKAKSTVDDAVLALAQMKGGALASFEATRLSTGHKNQNRVEIHGEKGAIRFNFERMGELDFYDATADEKTHGWTNIQVSDGGAGHPYADAWWPVAHPIGYEHTFINMSADILRVLGGRKPVVPLPDFDDAYQTQRVIAAIIESAKSNGPIKISEIK